MKLNKEETLSIRATMRRILGLLLLTIRTFSWKSTIYMILCIKVSLMNSLLNSFNPLKTKLRLFCRNKELWNKSISLIPRNWLKISRRSIIARKISFLGRMSSRKPKTTKNCYNNKNTDSQRTIRRLQKNWKISEDSKPLTIIRPKCSRVTRKTLKRISKPASKFYWRNWKKLRIYGPRKSRLPAIYKPRRR